MESTQFWPVHLKTSVVDLEQGLPEQHATVLAMYEAQLDAGDLPLLLLAVLCEPELGQRAATTRRATCVSD